MIVLGLTFKEDCPDIRTCRVINVIRDLQDYGCNVVVHDPLAYPKEAMHDYDVALTLWNELPMHADAIVIAVAHREYRELAVESLLVPLK